MLLLPALPVPDFWITQSIYIGLYALVALGLVLLTGVAGLTSFGQAAFVGIGAYAAAYLATQQRAAAAGDLDHRHRAGGAGGAVPGRDHLAHVGPLPAAGDHRLGPGAELHDGQHGVAGQVRRHPRHSGDDACSASTSAPGAGCTRWSGSIALLAALAVLRLLDSRPGRAIRALKHGSTMAEAMGISTFRYKLTAFVLAAVLAAVSGWLFAHFQRSVSPSPFGINKGIEYLFMAVLGGVGHVWGAFLGSAVVRLVEDHLQVLLPQLLGTSGNFETIVFGIVLVVVLKYAPEGLWSFVGRWLPAPPRARDWGSAEPLPRACQAGARRAPAGSGRGAQAVRWPGRRQRHQLRAEGRRHRRADRPQRRRQVDHLQPDHRRAAAVGWRRALARRIDRRQAVARDRPARHFAHLPARQAGAGDDACSTTSRSAATGARHPVCCARCCGSTAPRNGACSPKRRRSWRAWASATQANELAGNLPLGSQRLVEIARALATDPALLLLDEPAAGLRHHEKQALAAVLRQLKDEGMSLLLVEHDMDFVMGLADRVVVMEFGTWLLEGTPAEVQASPEVRAAYLGEEH